MDNGAVNVDCERSLPANQSMLRPGSAVAESVGPPRFPETPTH